MKVQKSLSHPGKEEKKKQSGESVRSLALVAVYMCGGCIRGRRQSGRL